MVSDAVYFFQVKGGIQSGPFINFVSVKLTMICNALLSLVFVFLYGIYALLSIMNHIEKISNLTAKVGIVTDDHHTHHQ